MKPIIRLSALLLLALTHLTAMAQSTAEPVLDQDEEAVHQAPPGQNRGPSPANVKTRAGAVEQPGVLIDRVVALVDEDVVTEREFEQRMSAVRRQLGDNRPPEADLRRQVLERLILERIQLQQAEELGIRIDDITLNNTMRDIARRNQLELAQFRDFLIADGINYDQFREQIRDELTISQLRQRQVDARIKVSEEEIDELIASQSGAIDRDVEYHLAQILIALPEAAAPEQIQAAREKAEALRERALTGEDFATLAAANSDGQKALEGGDLGWRSATQLPTLFSRPVTLMQAGDVGELIRSPAGFHIIKLLERRGGQRSIITQTHARHILIKTDALTTEHAAREKLKNILNALAAGEDFAALAKAHSDDPGSASNGGDLGWASPGNFVPEFERTMDALDIGQVSEPIRSQFGWHIIQVLERRERDTTREMLRANARKFIHQRKRDEETSLWLRRLRDEAYVEFITHNEAG